MMTQLHISCPIFSTLSSPKWLNGSHPHAVTSPVHTLFQSLFIYKDYLSCSESTASGQLWGYPYFPTSQAKETRLRWLYLCAKKGGKWSSVILPPEGSLMILFPLLCLSLCAFCAHISEPLAFVLSSRWYQWDAAYICPCGSDGVFPCSLSPYLRLHPMP